MMIFREKFFKMATVMTNCSRSLLLQNFELKSIKEGEEMALDGRNKKWHDFFY